MPALTALLALISIACAAEGLEIDFLFEVGRRSGYEDNKLNYPSNLTVDQDTGDVYVMDLLFNRVQRFDSEGNHLATWSCPRTLGLEWDPHLNVIWAAGWVDDNIRKYALDGTLLATYGSSGTGPLEFDFPHDIAVHPINGNIYVLDDDNERVQIMTPDGVYIDEFEVVDEFQPFGIEIDPTGEWLIVTNSGAREVHKYSTDGVLIEMWDEASSEPGGFRWPRDTTIDAEGHVFIADTDNERVQMLDSDGNWMAFVIGPSNRVDGSFHPRAVSVNRSTRDLYVTPAYAQRVDRFVWNETTGVYDFVRSFGVRDRVGPEFNQIKGVNVDPRSGDIFVSDWMDHRVKRFDQHGRFLGQFDYWITHQTTLDGAVIDQEAWAADPTLQHWIVRENEAFPSGADVDDEGNFWALRGSMHYDDDPRTQADWLVRRFTPQGEFIQGFGHTDFPRNAKMRDIKVDSASQMVYVANSDNHALMKFDWDGNLIWTRNTRGSGAGQLNYPTGLALDVPNNRIFVAEAGNDRISVFDLDGTFLRSFSSFGTGDGQVKLADFSHITLDEHGILWVADTGNNRISAFNADGTWLNSWGEYGFGGYLRYSGVTALDVHDGRLFVGDNAGYHLEVFQIRYPDSAR